MDHAKRPLYTERGFSEMPTGLPTMTWNIINAQLMEVRGPTIMTVVGAITNGMDIRIIIGSIARVAVS